MSDRFDTDEDDPEASPSDETFERSDVAKSYLKQFLDSPEEHALSDFSHNVCRIFMESPLTDSERRHAEELLRDLAQSVELQVRETLSEQLKTSRILPHDVAVVLANDVESVALPILEFSEVLTDADLMEIIKSKGAPQQSAIARRETVSEVVAAAIVRRGEVEPVTTLMENPGAKIDEETYDNVVVLFPNNDPIKEALARRPDLPVNIAGKVIDLVSESLQFELISRHNCSSKLIEKVVAQGNEGAMIALLVRYEKIDDAEMMATQLNAVDKLTPTIIARALYHGQIDFLEFALSRLSQVSVQEVRRQLMAPRGAAFQRLYRRAGLPARLFAAVSEALQHLNEELVEINGEETPPDARRRANALVRHRDFDNPEFEATLLMMEAG